VSTYTDYKDISTLNFKTAPISGTSYKLNFANENIETVTKTVKSSDTDKSLETVLGFSLDESEYPNVKVTNGTTTYKYGRDFTINSDGEIEWLEQTEITNEPASYTVTYDKSIYQAISSKASNGVRNLTDLTGDNPFPTYSDFVSSYNLPVTPSTLRYANNIIDFYSDDFDDSYNFAIGTADSDGTFVTGDYVYGRDYVLRKESSGDINLIWSDNTVNSAFITDYQSYVQTTHGVTISTSDTKGQPSTRYMVKFNQTQTAENESDELETLLNGYDGDYNSITITDSDGNVYECAASEDNLDDEHFAIVNGELVWNTTPITYNDPSRPTASTEYELIYTSTDGGELFKIDEAVTRSNSDVIALTSSGSSIDYDEMVNGTVTITQGSKVFYENYDFEIGKNDNGEVTIDWKTGTNYEWYYPQPGANSRYSINLVTADGDTKTYSGVRSYTDTLDLRSLSDDCYFEVAEGSLTKLTYNKVTYDLTDAADDDETTTTDVEIVRDTLGLSIADGTNGGKKIFNFNWVTPDLEARDNLPAYGDEIEISYDYYANTFTLSDDGDGIIDLLGLNDDVTEAQNAIIVLDNTQIEKDLNDIGADYDNEISNLKGVTLHLKGVGEVSLDIFHDAEKAVESIQTYVDNYNSLMSWINTRMTESQVDEDTAATVDSDDFRMRWGLLHGNSLLRNAKSQMRNISAQNFTYSFTKRTSAGEIYGTMANNGLTSSSTFRLRIGSTYSDITIEPTDTLETIAAKINDDTATAQARNLHYDSNGQKLEDALLKASVEQDKLVISSSGTDEITISGTAAMNALKMNYTYKGVYQLGIGVNANATLGSTSTVDLTKAESGELEFNTDKFMEALEDNPDETQELMLMYANSMDNWVKSMTTASNDEYGSPTGSLSREIKNLENEISDIDEYLEKYQERLDRMEESLRTKYAAAEQRISKLSQQASAIASILQQLSNSGGNNNSSASS
ncbi:MAG: flagellar filament capping protein FliD, partial [Synergistaceae bacterium]|nr:flagellar filament capping protein FliD [Synergistaceae bacterium]